MFDDQRVDWDFGNSDEARGIDPQYSKYPLVISHSCGKSATLMGKSILSMVIFPSYVILPEGNLTGKIESIALLQSWGRFSWRGPMSRSPTTPARSPKPALRSASSVSRSPKSPNIRTSNMSMASGESVPLGSHLDLTWISLVSCLDLSWFKLIMCVHLWCLRMNSDDLDTQGFFAGFCWTAPMFADLPRAWIHWILPGDFMLGYAECMSFCSEISEDH